MGGESGFDRTVISARSSRGVAAQDVVAMRAWPIVRWTRYGRRSDDGARVYASGEHLAKSGREVVIYEAHEARGLLDARR